MRESEPELFEAELRRLKPAMPTEELMARLEAEIPAGSSVTRRRAPANVESRFWQVALRWLIPATGVVAVLVAVASLKPKGSVPSGTKKQVSAPSLATPALLKADNVEVDQQMVSSFDAVARLPGGEPVRFRCTEWMDEVVLRDSIKGVAVAQRIPRLEIVPVRFETY
jgi:hypothetical protein